MSAERLRSAASLLRDRAEAATPGPWKTWAMDVLADPTGDSNLDTAIPVARGTIPDGQKPRTHNTDFIAMMSPPVALALADWLDATTTYLQPGMSIEDDLCLKHALAVADAILGDRK